eukprot:15356402-Ditylum_brightwellii.AAC.1
MDSLAISVQEQLSANQNSLQQIMQKQRDHLDAKIIVLLDGPHNKHQKHSNMDAVLVDVMADADALCRNRDACAPDPGGTGSP